MDDAQTAEQTAETLEEAAPKVRPPLDDAGLDLLFRQARTHHVWSTQTVSDDELRRVFEVMKLAPTSANCAPARFVFLRTKEAREKLRPALSAGNLDKTMAAPVTAIVAYDPKFYEYLPRLYPQSDAKAWFAGNVALAEETALRNATLQGGYFILAARALGLDVGPMSGFDRARVDEIFLADRGWKSNFLVNLGHGDAAALPERAPRFWFDEVCVLS